MKKVVYGQDVRIINWAQSILTTNMKGLFKDAHGIGIEEDGNLLAACVYDGYVGTSITLHIAAVPGKRWMTKGALFAAFAYPFKQLGCTRVSGLVRLDNVVAQKFDEHLGFKREGLLRRWYPDGCDAIVYGMLREECRFLKD